MKDVRSVLLDCEHTAWFKVIHAPNPGEIIWCSRCAEYRTVPQHDSERPTYYPDGNWNCYRRGKVRVRGECLDCGHEFTGAFNQVRTHMEKHHRTNCEFVLAIAYVPLPPNSPPPF